MRDSAPHGPVTVGAEELVVLVDEEDREIGTSRKLSCHQRGQLHRAVSVNVVDRRGNILLQQRAQGKYHSGGLWSNSCCTHPRPGENSEQAARRRLREELGFDCVPHFSRKLRYSADVGQGLVENELVHIFGGIFEGEVKPNPAEVQSFMWISREDLDARLQAEPAAFTAWFKAYISVGAI